MTRILRGAVQRTVGAYDGLISGTIGVSFPAQAIYQEQRAILEVIVQNDPASAVNVVVGGQFAQHYVLVPGASVTIPVNDLNEVYAGTLGGNATVNWLAMT